MSVTITEISKKIADKLYEFNLENDLYIVLTGIGDIKKAKIPDISESTDTSKSHGTFLLQRAGHG